MRRALFGFGLCLFGALFAAQAIAAAPTPGKDKPYPMVATPALWTVHGSKGTAYLLGSIHMLPKNVSWQTPQILAAVKRADTFVFEIPMDEDSKEHDAEALGKDMILPISTSLVSLFDEDMRNDFRKVIAVTHADPTYIVYMRPWLAAMDIEGSESGDPGFVADEGVDNKINAMARARKGVQYRAFETFAFQSHLLMGSENLSDELASLRKTFKLILANGGETGVNIDGLLTAWAKGDVKTLAAAGPENPWIPVEDRKAMFENRNRSWIPQIEAMLKEKHTYFITVGAGHLAGKIGVPNLLRQAGYQVDGP